MLRPHDSDPKPKRIMPPEERERRRAAAQRNAKISASQRAKRQAKELPARWIADRTIKTLEKALADSESRRIPAERELAKLRYAHAETARDLRLARERIERLERELRECRVERVSASEIARRLAA